MALDMQRDLPKRRVHSFADHNLDSCVRKDWWTQKEIFPSQIKWGNINTTIFLSHFVSCAAQSNDVCKMSHDRCPQWYGSICQQTLLLDITFSLLSGKQNRKSKLKKTFSSKFTGIEEGAVVVIQCKKCTCNINVEKSRRITVPCWAEAEL